MTETISFSWDNKHRTHALSERISKNSLIQQIVFETQCVCESLCSTDLGYIGEQNRVLAFIILLINRISK